MSKLIDGQRDLMARSVLTQFRLDTYATGHFAGIPISPLKKKKLTSLDMHLLQSQEIILQIFHISHTLHGFNRSFVP